MEPRLKVPGSIVVFNSDHGWSYVANDSVMKTYLLSTM